MKRKLYFMTQVAIIYILLALSSAQAYYGWEANDDPVPFYYQQAGKWYVYSDAKIFMVQLNDRTYKYIFDSDGSFKEGLVTDLPMRLP